MLGEGEEEEGEEGAGGGNEEGKVERECAAMPAVIRAVALAV